MFFFWGGLQQCPFFFPLGFCGCFEKMMAWESLQKMMMTWERFIPCEIEQTFWHRRYVTLDMGAHVFLRANQVPLSRSNTGLLMSCGCHCHFQLISSTKIHFRRVADGVLPDFRSSQRIDGDIDRIYVCRFVVVRPEKAAFFVSQCSYVFLEHSCFGCLFSQGCVIDVPIDKVFNIAGKRGSKVMSFLKYSPEN